MKKAEITIEEKKKFIEAFEAIIQKSSPVVQKLWDGQIVINNNIVIIPSGVHKKFEPRLADKFLGLLNRSGLVV